MLFRTGLSKIKVGFHHFFFTIITYQVKYINSFTHDGIPKTDVSNYFGASISKLTGQISKNISIQNNTSFVNTLCSLFQSVQESFITDVCRGVSIACVDRPLMKK